MKAAVIHEFGDFDVLKVEEVPTPEPQAGEVLIKILATGVNRLEDYIREGSLVPELEWPHILGADVAGEVAALGDDVTGFAIGERVIPQPGFPTDPADYETRVSRILTRICTLRGHNLVEYGKNPLFC